MTKKRVCREGGTNARSCSAAPGCGVFPEADNRLLHASPNAIRKESL